MRRLVATVLFAISLLLGLVGLGRATGLTQRHAVHQQAQCGIIIGSIMGRTPGLCITWPGPLN